MEKVIVTCRGFSCTASIAEAAERDAAKLFRVFGDAQGCHVTVSLLHRKKRQGKIFHVNVRVSLPWGEVNVSRQPEHDHAHENFAVAMRDAFLAARRKMEDEVRIRRGFVKTHSAPEPLPQAS